MSNGRYFQPGQRKNNPWIVWRGYIGRRLVEVSTKTLDQKEAEGFVAALAVDLLKTEGEATSRPLGRPDTFQAKFGAQTAAIARIVSTIIDTADTISTRNWLTDRATRDVTVDALAAAVHAIGDAFMNNDPPMAPGPTKQELKQLKDALAHVVKAVVHVAANPTAEPRSQLAQQLREYLLKVGAPRPANKRRAA